MDWEVRLSINTARTFCVEAADKEEAIKKAKEFFFSAMLRGDLNFDEDEITDVECYEF